VESELYIACGCNWDGIDADQAVPRFDANIGRGGFGMDFIHQVALVNNQFYADVFRQRIDPTHFGCPFAHRLQLVALELVDLMTVNAAIIVQSFGGRIVLGENLVSEMVHRLGIGIQLVSQERLCHGKTQSFQRNPAMRIGRSSAAVSSINLAVGIHEEGRPSEIVIEFKVIEIDAGNANETHAYEFLCHIAEAFETNNLLVEFMTIRSGLAPENHHHGLAGHAGGGFCLFEISQPAVFSDLRSLSR